MTLRELLMIFGGAAVLATCSYALLSAVLWAQEWWERRRVRTAAKYSYGWHMRGRKPLWTLRPWARKRRDKQ
jgi:hypothetical protein